jgi:rhodanese-related sulfurtransferase
MKQMTATELQTILQSGEHTLMIDVREAHELVNGMIEGAIHIPMNDVPGRLAEFSEYKDKPVVLICRSGMRSEQVGDFMRLKGFKDLINLKGGMNGWAKDVDASMTVY